MKLAYTIKNFTDQTLSVIEQANTIIAEYQKSGYYLTLRQLYYQFVARDLIDNTQKAYKRIGSIMSEGRLAGLVSWNAIEDRTRNLESQSHWNNPKELLESAAAQFQVDKWADQKYRPEVWVEKEALAGVVAKTCDPFDVPYFACRGYVSQSELWTAGQRFIQYRENGQIPIVFHLGDHDPSGIDMTRDNSDRLALFTGLKVQVERLALNYEQVKKYGLPPNPAKLTDSRIEGYLKNYGAKSWELDALDPSVISELIEDAITGVIDFEHWEKTLAVEERGRQRLSELAEQAA